MDTIDTFLDAMFAPYPSTPRLLEAKGELRAMMEDAYADAVGRGRTHNEAGGSAAIALNGANEYLVSELLAGRLEFWKISHILREFMSGYIPSHDYDIEDIAEIDVEARAAVSLLTDGF